MKHSKKIITSLATAFIGLTATIAAGSNQYFARISQLHAYQNGAGQPGVVYFALENNGTRGTLPACVTDGRYVLMNNADNEVAKSQVGLLIMAFSQGRPITVWGSGVCQGTKESVIDIEIDP